MPMRPSDRFNVPGVTKRCSPEKHPYGFACDCAFYIEVYGKGRMPLSGWWKAQHPGVIAPAIRNTTQLKKVVDRYTSALITGEKAKAKALEPMDVTVAMLVAEYCREKEGLNELSFVKQLVPAFGPLRLADFVTKREGIVKALNVVAKDKGPTYWRRALAAWVTWFHHVTAGERFTTLTDGGGHIANPFLSKFLKDAAANHPKRLKRRVKFGSALIGKILFHCDWMMKLRVRGAVETGLRRGELLEVRKSQVKLDSRRPHIFLPALQTKAGKRTHDDAEVLLDLVDASFLKQLRERLGKIGDTDYVFGHEDGSYLSSEVFDGMWQPIYRAAGILVTSHKVDDEWQPQGKTWHDLRHEFAWKVARKTNGNALEIQLRGRWSDLKTASFYANHYENDEEEDVLVAVNE